MRLTDLETFVWLATMRSFRAVAQRLNITQPAISARIATLERELEVVLFERNQRSVVLTSKGLQLLAHAQGLVKIAEELRALAKPDTMVGVVRIGVVETIVHTWLPELMERLHGRYQGLSIELMVDTTVNLRDWLVAREIDAACLMGRVAKPEMPTDLPAPSVWPGPRAPSSSCRPGHSSCATSPICRSSPTPASPARSLSLTICSAATTYVRPK